MGWFGVPQTPSSQLGRPDRHHREIYRAHPYPRPESFGDPLDDPSLSLATRVTNAAEGVDSLDIDNRALLRRFQKMSLAYNFDNLFDNFHPFPSVPTSQPHSATLAASDAVKPKKTRQQSSEKPPTCLRDLAEREDRRAQQRLELLGNRCPLALCPKYTRSTTPMMREIQRQARRSQISDTVGLRPSRRRVPEKVIQDYDAFWQDLKSRATEQNGLSFDRLPHPTLTPLLPISEVTTDTLRRISAFIDYKATRLKKSRRDTATQELLLWKPDSFECTILPHFSEDSHEQIRETSINVTILLNTIIAQTYLVLENGSVSPW